MKGTALFFLILGCLLIVAAAVLRITQYPIIVSATALKPSSIISLANSAFILAVLFKK